MDQRGDFVTLGIHVTIEIKPNFVAKCEVHSSVNQNVVLSMDITAVWLIDIVFSFPAVLRYVLYVNHMLI